MNSHERNRRIFEIRKAHPAWTYQEIGELLGLSRQRVQQIVREVDSYGIIDAMEEKKNDNGLCQLDPNKPISPTQAAREMGIPITTITGWIAEGQVKLVKDPGQTGPGRVNLLDPVSLQERIDRYRPRPRRTPVPV